MMFDISSMATAKGDTLNRIELSELLMNEYLYVKQDWEVERDSLISQASQVRHKVQFCFGFGLVEDWLQLLAPAGYSRVAKGSQ